MNAGVWIRPLTCTQCPDQKHSCTSTPTHLHVFIAQIQICYQLSTKRVPSTTSHTACWPNSRSFILVSNPMISERTTNHSHYGGSCVYLGFVISSHSWWGDRLLSFGVCFVGRLGMHTAKFNFGFPMFHCSFYPYNCLQVCSILSSFMWRTQ